MTRDAERFVTERPGITSRHLLSFGDHYDPARIAIGPIVALNDESVEPGAGFAEHPHSGVDIVTWVVTGALAHVDSTGTDEIVRAGEAQVLRAAAGVRHMEVNASSEPGETLRFIQTWLTTPAPDAPPRYEHVAVDIGEAGAGFVPVASSEPEVMLYGSRVFAGVVRGLPSGDRKLVMVVVGAVVLNQGASSVELRQGDTAVVGAGGSVTGAAAVTELLVWVIPPDRGR